MGTQADTRTLGGKLETQLRDWTLGFETYQRFWGAHTEMAKMNYMPQFSVPDVRVSQVGVYTEYLKPFSDNLSLRAGARVDRVGSRADENRANTSLYRAYHNSESISGVDVFPSGYTRLDYRLRRGFDLAVKTGTAVQVPEPSERYFALRRKGTDWVGNPELSPSRTTGIEGTLSLEREGIFITGGPFFDRVDGFVTLYNQSRLNEVAGVANNQARTYANTDARLWGAEVAMVFPLEDRLFLSGDLSYVEGTKLVRPELGILSDRLAEIPPLRGRLNLRFQEARFFASVEGVFSAAQHEIDTDLSEEMTPSYAILNLSGGVSLGRFSFSAGIGNLFNRTYREHLSYQRDPFRSGVRVNEPGRSLSANLGVDF
jgi:iron complex outermembrane receptor protein